MTATFTPNTSVGCQYNDGSGNSNLRFRSCQHRRKGGSNTVPTYAALTSRSYHPGGVNAAFMDGSVHTISTRSIPFIWQALSTHAGGETFDSTGF